MIHGHHIKIKARYILIQTHNELSFAKIRQSRRSINLHEIAPPRFRDKQAWYGYILCLYLRDKYRVSVKLYLLLLLLDKAIQ